MTPQERERDPKTIIVRFIHPLEDLLDKIDGLRARGEIKPHKASEVSGEYPGSEVPVEVILEDESRLQRLQEWAREHKKEVVVTSTLATGAVVALVGAAWTLKHYLERKEEK